MSGNDDHPTGWLNTWQVPVAKLVMNRDSTSRACYPSYRWGFVGRCREVVDPYHVGGPLFGDFYQGKRRPAPNSPRSAR